MAVLLTAPADVDPETFNADASRRWHHFVTLLRRRYPLADLQYWRVAELQERGHVHFHFVLRGLQYLAIADTSGGPGLRTLALTAGFGSWVGVRRPRDYPGGVRSVGSYFGKYLLKRYQGRIGVVKLATFSQGWRIGWENRRERGTGRWIYAGPVGAPWRVVGQVVDPARVPRATVEPWRPAWHRLSWQYYRKRERLPIALRM